MRKQNHSAGLLVGWVGLLCLAASGHAVWAQGVQPKVVTLDNGLQFIMVERHEQPTVAAGVFYNVGSVNDPAGKSGIAHLFEHMLFKGTKVIGTKDYAAEEKFLSQIDELRGKMNAEMDAMRVMKRLGKVNDVLDPAQWTPAYTAMKKQEDELIAAQREYIKNNELFNLYTTNGGAGLNAGTAEDVTMYFVELPSNKFELFFWLESDRMVNGVMREFYVERDNVREERRLRTESTPTGKFDESFEALFWQSHPYGIPVVGWASEVESITADDVRDYYKIHYAPNNATVVLVGDFKTDQAVEMANRYFGSIPRGTQLPPMLVTEEPPPIAERRFYAEAETNPQVRIRYHGVAMGHVDEPALEVLTELLSGKTGRLYKRLVAADEAAIGRPNAGLEARKYAGYLEINATVKEGRTPEDVETLILEEVEKLREGEIGELELQKVKNQVLASSVQRLRSSFGLMFQLGILETWYDWSYINESPEKMMKVTPDDVRAVVKKYLDPSVRTTAIYRTKGGAAAAEDPELAAVLAPLSEEEKGQVKMMVKMIKEAKDKDRLAAQAQGMEAALASGQVPDEEKPLLAYMIQLFKARLAELEGGEKKEAK